MVSLIDGVILNKTEPQYDISFKYDRGQVVRISYEDHLKFDFLSLKLNKLDSGTFRVNNKTLFPEENQKHSLFCININSVVKVGLVFVPKNEDRANMVKEVQEQLFDLRDLPERDNKEKDEKIAAIFRTIRVLSPDYILVDLNEKANQNNIELNKQLTSISGHIITIVLEVNPNPVDAPVEVITVQKEDKAPQNDLMALNIGDFPEDKVEENEQAKDFLIYGDFKTKFYKVIWDTFKYNAMVFFSFLIPTIGVIAFLLLCPLYFQTNNKLLLIPFVITISICFVLYMLMTYKCTTFAPGKADANKGKKRITFSIINTIVTLIGIGLGIVIYVLFKNYDSELKALPFNKTGVILAVVFSVILITACLYLSPILNAIFGLFRKLFSKEKGTKK